MIIVIVRVTVAIAITVTIAVIVSIIAPVATIRSSFGPNARLSPKLGLPQAKALALSPLGLVFRRQGSW